MLLPLRSRPRRIAWAVATVPAVVLLYIPLIAWVTHWPLLPRTVAQAVMTLAALAIGFAAIEGIAPEKVITPWWSRCRRADVFWWFAGYISRPAQDIAVAAATLLLIHVLPGRPNALINAQPIALQVAEALVVGDFGQYWAHRTLHRPLLWALHAVHHSTEDLDWLSTTRFHPLELLFRGPIEMLPLWFLGFSPETLPAVLILVELHEILLHANVSWDFGPFRYVITSPAYHRWHHSVEVEAWDKNFAGVFPLYDVVFGTLYFPSRPSTAYGLGAGQRMSANPWDQLWHPFRSAITVSRRSERAA